MKPHRRLLSGLCILVGALATSIGAQAAPAQGKTAHPQRLRGLSASELTKLQPHLARGPVALIEFANMDKDELPAINIATYVDAPVATVVEVITHPEHYPKFTGVADRVEVRSRGADAVVYDWAWSMAIFRMGGRNVMRAYLPADKQSKRGARITIDSQSGDMGTGRTSIRVLPRNVPASQGHPPRVRSLLVLSMRLDLRDANYVARELSKAARSINRSANMSLAYAMVLGFQAEAQRRSGSRPAAMPDRPFARPTVRTRQLLPLLRRGDLLLLDMQDGELQQLAVVGAVGRPAELVREVLLDADSFGSALMPGSEATVLSKNGDVTVFDWDIDLPLVGVSGRMRMQDRHDTIAVEATDGALAGGRWNFAIEAWGRRASVVTGWARFDLERSSWWIRQLIEKRPNLGHGISAASEVILLRALRSKTRKRGQERKVSKPKVVAN